MQLKKSSDEARAREEQSHHAIRDMDLEAYFQDHAEEIEPSLADYKANCPEGEDLIREVRFDYGDLDGDGNDEAIYQGWTCMAGNAQDLWGVLKLTTDNKIVALPVTPFKSPFQGRDPFEGLRGGFSIQIENGKLEEMYPVYRDNECQACSSGGERKLVHRWDGHSFVPDAIIDVPPDKNGH